MKPKNQQTPGPLVDGKLTQNLTFAAGRECLRTSRDYVIAVGGWEADARLLRLAYDKIDALARALNVDACELLENVDLEKVLRFVQGEPLAASVLGDSEWRRKNLPLSTGT